MLYILLGISSLSVAWLAWQAAEFVLGRFSDRLRSEKLRNLVGAAALGRTEIPRGTKPPPFGDLAAILGSQVQHLARDGSFGHYLAHLSTQLRRGGLSSTTAVQLLGYQVLGGISGGLVFGVLSGSLELALFTLLLGLLLPRLWVRDKALLRERRLLLELPNALESLSLCSEAGLSLEQGIEQYVKSAGPGPLREEFARVLEQTQSGSARKGALEVVASRLGLTDFNLFASSVIQAEKFGTGVSKTLRQLAVTLRDKRSQRAEKAVQELPVKLLLPLILCIMPVTFLIIFGPLLLQFLNP